MVCSLGRGHCTSPLSATLSLSLLWASWVEEGRPAKSGLTEPYDSKGGVADREGGNASRVLMIYDLFTIQI